MHRVPDVLEYLAGTWRVERSVRDPGSGAEGTFTGRTVFEPTEPIEDGGGSGDGGTEESDRTGLLHLESGVFIWQGTARPAERTLRFLPGGTPGTAEVRFADGRPFHGLDLRTGRHTADHPCSADLYQGEFEASGPDTWRSVWRVVGPAKNLLLVTAYTRG